MSSPRVFRLMVIMQATSASRKYIRCVPSQCSWFPSSGELEHFNVTGIRLTSDLGFKATSRTIASCSSKEDRFDPAYAPQARTAWKTALTSGDSAMQRGRYASTMGMLRLKMLNTWPVMAGRVFERKTLSSFSHHAHDDHPSPTCSWGMIKPYRAQATQRPPPLRSSSARTDMVGYPD
jgi:hypothetical protein